MVLEDALTILSYASSYPVTLRISKTPGQETLFAPSGQLSSDQELGTSSADIRSRERGSRRPSINPLYRSQSLDNLADLKAGADRSINEFRSSADHLTRRFSEFRAPSPECLRRNKKLSTLYRWSLQQNELELKRLYRADTVDLTLGSKDRNVDSTRVSMFGEPRDTNDTVKTDGDTSEKIQPVGLERPIAVQSQSTNHCAAILTNEDTPTEKVDGFLTNSLNLEGSGITTTVANRSTDLHNEEAGGSRKNLSSEDTRVIIDDIDRQVTVRDRNDIEIDNDASYGVMNDFKALDVSTAGPSLGVIDSTVSNVRLNIDRTEHSDYVLTSDDIEPFDRPQRSAEGFSADSEQYASKNQKDRSETGRTKSNFRIEYGMAEQFRNAAVNFDNDEKRDTDDRNTLELGVLDRVVNDEELYESDTGERINRKSVATGGECSTVIHVEDPLAVDSELTTVEVIEPSQLEPTNASPPSSKGFLKTLKRLFNFERSRSSHEGETSLREDQTLNNKGKRSNRKKDKSSLASNGQTGGSNSNRQIDERDSSVVFHAGAFRELSFSDAAAGGDDSDPEEDLDRAIADFMGITSSETGKSEALEVCCPIESNSVGDDGITTDPSELNPEVTPVTIDGASGVAINSVELKLDIPQTSSQTETETGFADEAPDLEITGLGRDLPDGVTNCTKEQLDQDVLINRQTEIASELNEFNHRKDFANVTSTESNSSAETSINTMESGRSQVPVRSANAETQKLELTETVASTLPDSHSHKQLITVISPLKKFQADRQDPKVIRPILKKFSSVSSSENDSHQNTDILTKTPDFPDEQVWPMITASSSIGQTKDVPRVISNGVTAPDERRVILEANRREIELEADTLVTINKRTGEEDSGGLVKSKAGPVGKLWNRVGESEAQESETERGRPMPWSAHAHPNYASHPEMGKTELCADESWGSVPQPNYALFSESFEAESDEEGSMNGAPMPNYENYPEEIEGESESENGVLYADTIPPSSANYIGVSNAGFRIGNSNTLPVSQRHDDAGFIMDTISDDFAALPTENEISDKSMAVSDSKNEMKTSSQVMKDLLEKLQGFGKRDSKYRTNYNVVATNTSGGVAFGQKQPQDIFIPFEKNGDGGFPSCYNEREEIGTSRLSGLDASESSATRSTKNPSENYINSSCVACEDQKQQLMKSPERSEIVIMDDADKRARIVFSPTTVLVRGHDAFNPDQRHTPKSVGDLNNNSFTSG